MFVKYEYIEEAHKAALRSVIAQHTIVTEPLLAKLYLIALNALKNGGGKEAGVFAHYIAGPDGKVGGATDEKTGIYVQLAVSKNQSPMLTVGSKWTMQAYAPELSQTATRHW